MFGIYICVCATAGHGTEFSVALHCSASMLVHGGATSHMEAALGWTLLKQQVRLRMQIWKSKYIKQ